MAKRLFIAIPVQLAPEYSQLLQQLRQQTAHDEITWVNTDLQHLTIKFLGKTENEQIPVLKKHLQELAAKTPVFSMKISKLGAFGSSYHPTIIRLGFNPQPAINQLFQQIENVCTTQLGFTPNNGNFVPHITLGRIKKIDNKKRFWAMIENLQPSYYQDITIDKIYLIRSQLETSGPIYTPLEAFPLQITK